MIENRLNSPDQHQPRVIYIKSDQFSDIESGRKTLELRVAFGSFSKIKTGDILEFRQGNNQSVRVRVKDTRSYTKLLDALDKENLNKIAPGISKEQAFVESEKFFKQEDIEKYGLVVIDFEKVLE